jgi:hypothetical protein
VERLAYVAGEGSEDLPSDLGSPGSQRLASLDYDPHLPFGGIDCYYFGAMPVP